MMAISLFGRREAMFAAATLASGVVEAASLVYSKKVTKGSNAYYALITIAAIAAAAFTVGVVANITYVTFIFEILLGAKRPLEIGYLTAIVSTVSSLGLSYLQMKAFRS